MKETSGLRLKKNESFNRELFDRRYKSQYDVQLLLPVYDKVIQFINLLQIDQPRILEIGCGLGILATKMFQNGYDRYLGIDISSQAIIRAKEQNSDHSSKFKEKSIFNLERNELAADITIAVEVLEHIDDITLINKLRSTYLIGTVPNYWARDNAHLRIYLNKFNIWNRFRKKMIFLNWYKHKLTKKRFIYIFAAKLKY